MNLESSKYSDANGYNWDAIAKAIEGCDETALSYFKTLEDGNGTINNQSASVEGLGAHLKATGKSFDFAAIKATLLNTALNAGIFLVASLAIQAVVKGLDHFINRAKYAKEAMEKAQDAIDDAQNKLKDVSSTIEENKDRFLELSEGVNKFSKNVKLSAEDYAEYLSISNKLAEISPELVSGYTDQGDALLYIGDNAEETSEKLNKVLEAEQAIAQQTLVDNIDNVANGIYYEVEEANSNLSNLKSQLDGVSTVYRDIKGIIKEVDEYSSSIDFGTGSGLNLDFDEMEQLKNAIRNSGAKITEDDVFDTMLFSSSEVSIVQKAIEDFYEQLDYTRKNESAAYINGITKDIQEQENAVKNAYAKMTPNLVAWAKSTYEYDFLDESGQKLIESLIPNIDWNDIREKTGNKLFSSADYEQYIKENIIVPLMSVPDKYQSDVNSKFAKLLEFDANDINLVDYVTELQEYLDSIGITINLTPLLNTDTIEAKKRFDDSLRKIFDNRGSVDRDTYEDVENGYERILEYTKDLTPEQQELWITATDGTHGAIEAINAYEAELAKMKQLTGETSISKTIDQLNTRLKPAMDSLHSAWQDMFNDDGKFDLKGVDILSTCDTIKSKLDEMKELGLKVDYSSFEELVRVLNNTESTEDDVKKAFDSLATSITKAGLSGTEDFETMKSALEDLGVVNNEMVAFDALIHNTEALKEAGLDLANATEEEIEAFVKGIGITEDYTQAVNLLKIQKILCAENPLDTSGDIMNLYLLANAAGIATDAIIQLMRLNAEYTKASAEGNTAAALVAKGQIEVVKQTILNQFANLGSEVDFSGITKSAGKSGKDAGDAYVDAFEEELKSLQSLRDRGVIDESEYLQRLRALYIRYFADRKEYLDEFRKYEREYLEGRHTCPLLQ